MIQTVALHSRRYIGSKEKLLDWIFSVIQNETSGVHSFCDIFAGTGVVANRALQYFNQVSVNDFLYANNIIYKAFWETGEWDQVKIKKYIEGFNSLDPKKIRENYFSKNFGGKFFGLTEAKKIGFIRQKIENDKAILTDKEYNILIASLIYGMDKIANTLGHYESYIKKEIPEKKLFIKQIDARSLPNISITRMDANDFAKNLEADIVYIDPPYNSRQYSRFYHIYETLVKWDMPKLTGTAMKPPLENMSKYCSSKAKDAFNELVQNLKTKYIAVSYNNTYHSKSSSSQNKIKLEEIINVLDSVGKTKKFEHSHRFFNAGKTNFADHKEFLFLTEVK